MSPSNSDRSPPATQENTPAERKILAGPPKQRLSWLYALATIYAAWLFWLAYAAWINIQAGNQ